MSFEIDADRWGLRRIEVPAREVIDYGLGQGLSLIEPDVRAWGADIAAELRHRIVDNADAAPGSFKDRLRTQLRGASRASHLLCAELLALQCLPLRNIGGAGKVERVEMVLSWLSLPAELPEELANALNGPGLFHGGVASNSGVAGQLGWLVTFVEYWCGLPADRRRAALSDPWAFRAVVDEEQTGQLAMRNSLLYLAFPRTFLPIVSQQDRLAIRNRFAELIGGSSGNDAVSIDRDLHAIHVRHTEQAGGARVSYYEEPYRSQWKKDARADDAVRAWLIRPKPVGHELAARWRSDGFVSLAATHLGAIDTVIGRKELNQAVEDGYQHLDYAQRLALANEYHQFLSGMKPDDLVATVAEDKLYVGVITGEPEITEERNARLRRAASWTPEPVGDIGTLTAPLATEVEQQGTVVDITSATATLAELIGSGTTADDVEPAGPVVLAPATQELAGQLHLEQAWLQEMIDLLTDRRQIVLYGPPGTGKTYVARKLAAHLTGPDAVRLVQFHPSYAYEDFFEGFRPQPDTASTPFALVPGPLRRLAAAARDDSQRPHVLIIDEINRANLAKVFGQLYFLLEYRDDSILLQYSPGESFSLPPNLFLIGTMNTADRSIALIDAAMRRRFAFLELHPDEPPVHDLLSRWAAAHGKDIERAALLDALNAAIDAEDRDFKIGPSYLMSPELDRDGGLGRVWRHSILPLLEEHYYGRLTRDQVHRRFGLDAVRRAAARRGE